MNDISPSSPSATPPAQRVRWPAERLCAATSGFGVLRLSFNPDGQSIGLNVQIAMRPKSDETNPR